MATRIISIVVLLAFFNYFTGCTVRNLRKVSREKITSQEKILEVVLVTGHVIKFDDAGGKFRREKRVITGSSEDGVPVEIDLDKVLEVRILKVDPVASVVLPIFAVVGVVALVFTVVLILNPIGPILQ